ncbi:D-glycero-alpha-D-manno-heptose-1,7-bisphosphate 7-phosphatase [Miniphocaeibacter halophilus]|uniref:HAD-IIIA family hydrolase n=1 Tax=Miniphocaeibacter halophilus TaxID=2931922 RepID=A0AC61MU25_9FIRM|nr:HAD-IIIA family hydrolase [Miniphocaeibacter halophilus]QQK06893.1 HAD-IIIA family hydrolase [Miniphocaeibacter halophilus]
MKIAFLDRDGTINKDYEDKQWTTIVEPEILPGSIEGLKYLQDKGFKFIIITNQYIIGENYITTKQYNDFNSKLIEILKDKGIDIDDIFYCPHARRENCNCIKPKKGMIEQALEKYPNIDMNKSIFIGDSKCDLELAENIGVKFFGINLNCKNKIRNIFEIRKYAKEL